MVQSDIETEKFKYTGGNDTQSETQGLGLRREPSFSRWCDEDGIVHSNICLESEDGSVEDFDFELPLLEQVGLENGISVREVSRHSKSQQFFQLNGGKNMDSSHIHVSEVGNGKYVPFDIENRSERTQSLSNSGDNGFNPTRNYDDIPPDPESSFSAANVLKTLFFILVWYTFSTFLTL